MPNRNNEIAEQIAARGAYSLLFDYVNAEARKTWQNRVLVTEQIARYRNAGGEAHDRIIAQDREAARQIARALLPPGQYIWYDPRYSERFCDTFGRITGEMRFVSECRRPVGVLFEGTDIPRGEITSLVCAEAFWASVLPTVKGQSAVRESCADIVQDMIGGEQVHILRLLDLWMLAMPYLHHAEDLKDANVPKPFYVHATAVTPVPETEALEAVACDQLSDFRQLLETAVESGRGMIIDSLDSVIPYLDLTFACKYVFERMERRQTADSFFMVFLNAGDLSDVRVNPSVQSFFSMARFQK